LIQITAKATTQVQVANILPEELVDHAELIEHGDDPIILVRVHDQGEGILPEDQQKIFEKFFRAPRSLTTPIRGSGLGLFICRRYIEAMSGRLWLERSNPNQGSIFSFYLPQVDAPNSTGEQDEREYETS
jgi:signal transduction histidine kinase